MAALARHNANQQATVQSAAEATRARQNAMHNAAQSMSFKLSNEDPWAGQRSVEEWLDSQDKTYCRYFASENGEKKE
jgi:hypothetical protein